MSIQHCLKKDNYLISKRGYDEDYSFTKSNKIDMTLSGKYLYKYPFHSQYRKIWDKYPSKTDENLLVNDINKRYQLKNKQKEIIIGSGTNGIIQNIIKVLYSNNSKYNLVTPYYSFNQAEYCVTSYGGYTKRVYCTNYSINYEKLMQSIDKNTRLVYICNPNNPTGLLSDNSIILDFLKKNNNVLVLLDESNIEYSNNRSMLEEDISSIDNLLVIKSFSKAYGLANLRIGYMVCSKDFYNMYRKQTTSHEFSGLSCILAKKVFNSNYYKKSIQRILKEKDYLFKELKKMNIEVISSKSNTLMTKTTFSEDTLQKIYLKNISIVVVEDEKKKKHIRIAVQDHKTNSKFIESMKLVIKNE